jgi:hypothetical protein
VLVACGEAPSLPPCVGVSVTRWPEADRLFDDARWRGGEGATTVDLGDDRLLWLFGESVIDGVRVDNTIAIQTGRDPSTATMAFHWREVDGAPAAFFPPQGERALHPGGGVRIGHGVVLFLGVGDGSRAWNGFWLPNPDAPPATWILEQAFLPPPRFPVELGASVVVEGRYLHAFARAPDGRIWLARVEADDAAGVDLSRAQWWDGSWVGHSAFLPTTPGLFPAETPAVLSVAGGRAVHAVGDEIALRTSPALTGPWSEACGLLQVGDASDARAQPGLTGADVVITAGLHFYKLMSSSGKDAGSLEPERQVRLLP